ncbi:hypothetical protein MTO96_011210 [Rhipicephalus appendiculatus]
MGTTTLARGEAPGFDTLTLALRIKSTVLHGKSPPTFSLRRSLGKVTSSGVRLPGYLRLHTAKLAQFTQVKYPLKPGNYETQQLSVYASSKTPTFPNLLMQWRPSSCAVTDPRFPVKMRGCAVVISSGRAITGLPNENIKVREGLQRQYTVQDAETLRRGSTPSSSSREPREAAPSCSYSSSRHVPSCVGAIIPNVSDLDSIACSLPFSQRTTAQASCYSCRLSIFQSEGPPETHKPIRSPLSPDRYYERQWTSVPMAPTICDSPTPGTRWYKNATYGSRPSRAQTTDDPSEDIHRQRSSTDVTAAWRAFGGHGTSSSHAASENAHTYRRGVSIGN